MNKDLKNVRFFRLGYEEVYQLGCQTADLLTTDSAEFATFGIDQSAKDNLNGLLINFKKRSFDQILLLKQETATEAKNNKAGELRKKFVMLEANLRNNFGRKSAIYKRFGLNSISSMSELELCSTAKMIVRFVNDDFSSILKFVVSEEMLTTFETLSNELNDLIVKQDVAMRNRKLATDLRIEEANKLYAEISKIRYIGKKMWAGISKTKQEAYLMPKLSSVSTEVNEEETFEVNNPVIDEDEEVSNS